MKDKILAFLMDAKAWIIGIPVVGVALWLLVKFIACYAMGICIM